MHFNKHFTMAKREVLTFNLQGIIESKHQYLILRQDLIHIYFIIFQLKNFGKNIKLVLL